MDGKALGVRLRNKDLSAAPKAVSLLENQNEKAEAFCLINEMSYESLGQEAPGHIIGVTGPPGVGKSSLISCLIRNWRKINQTVAVLAVDPSSRYSGGAILGDRARIEFDPSDKGLFIRSSAAHGNLGGLSWATHGAAMVLAGAFDIVVVETVGVGQSEADIADVADTIVLVIQPSSGDTLQYMKAGIMEIPDILVVNKMDLGSISQNTFSALQGEARNFAKKQIPVIATSSLSPFQGIDELAAALETKRETTDFAKKRAASRQAEAYKMFRHEYGQDGLRVLGEEAVLAWLKTKPHTPALELFSMLKQQYLSVNRYDLQTKL